MVQTPQPAYLTGVGRGKRFYTALRPTTRSIYVHTYSLFFLAFSDAKNLLDASVLGPAPPIRSSPLPYAAIARMQKGSHLNTVASIMGCGKV